MQVLADVTLTPLRQPRLSPAIRAVWQALDNHPVGFEPGELSTFVRGDAAHTFAALQEGFAAAAHEGDAELSVRIRNGS